MISCSLLSASDLWWNAVSLVLVTCDELQSPSTGDLSVQQQLLMNYRLHGSTSSVFHLHWVYKCLWTFMTIHTYIVIIFMFQTFDVIIFNDSKLFWKLLKVFFFFPSTRISSRVEELFSSPPARHVWRRALIARRELTLARISHNAVRRRGGGGYDPLAIGPWWSQSFAEKTSRCASTRSRDCTYCFWS